MLQTKGIDLRRGGTKENEPRRLHGLSEGRVLGEEPVARVDRIGLFLQRDGQEGFAIQIGVGQRSVAEANGAVRQVHVGRGIVGFRIDRNAFHAPGPQGAEYTNRDCAAVRDQDALNHRKGSVLSVPEQELHGGGVKAAAGIVQLGAVGNEDQDVHVRHELHVLARTGNTLLEA